ncbi:TRAP transporter substrate-binding protein [Parvibium lacunae]|uniref:C4-dicarboxylate ABC transporter substrate-binding protein n=1 Tax=Parvibium lacunae TaxID=1888893 RepID=A0A368L810_9BURK|nr:TRAP transporter substrate-binding protein [Parvibium lacunae]RCS59838.1 C4-dicarboxylate ABC transporter substrate-binding protein [Parvibium lacunae]
MQTLKRRAVKASLLASLMAPLFAFAQTKWDLASAYPISNPHTVTLQQFAKDLDTATAGKLKVTVHPNGSLVKAPEIKRAMVSGQIAMGEVIMSILENENAIFGLDSVPFLASSFGQAERLWNAQRPAVEKILDAQGIKLLYAVPWPPQGMFAKKPVNEVADLKGLKWRAYNPTTQRIAKEYGAQPVTIQASELSQALATGVVEAFMTSAATGVDSKVWEGGVNRFYTVDAWLPKNMVIVSKSAFNQLDAATQAAIVKTAKETEVKGWNRMKGYTNDTIETLKKNGVEVAAPSQSFSQEMIRFGVGSLKDWLAKTGADGQAIIDTYNAKK